MAEPLIVLDKVTKRYGAETVLNGVDLTVEVGQVLVVIGPSGSGKSTLLRCLARLEEIRHGRILIDGKLVSKGTEDVGPSPEAATLSALRNDIGMVFQSFNLFPHLTVMQNVTLAPRRVLGMAAVEAEAQAIELLKRVGLEDKRDAYPSRMSGGQQQRAAIARALAKRGMTMLVVTHEMGVARDVADDVIFMDRGAIVERSPPKRIFAEPAEARTRAFLERLLEREGGNRRH
jgi:polar amino acid transport system ATP-binding protein